MTRIVTQRVTTNQTRQFMLLKGVLFIMLLLAAVYFFMNSSFFAIEKITVVGTQAVSSDDILDLAGVNQGANIFKIDPRQVENNVELSAMVAQAKVEVSLPGSVIIDITERKPAVLISSRQGFLLLDADGYYIRLVEKITDHAVPLVNGVEPPASLVPGDKLTGTGITEALKVAASLTLKERTLFSEILVTDSQFIEMYSSDGTRIILGDSDDIERKLQWYRQISEQAEQDEKNLKYVDVSFKGNPVIKYR